MMCRGCGNQKAYVLRSLHENGVLVEFCNLCASEKPVSLPDVYFREPYHDENLGDHKKSPDGVWVTSKRHKSQLMAEQGLREAGDRRHGAR